MIHLYKDLYIADPWPAAYLKDIDAMIFADLHLGMEGVLSEEGIFLPRSFSKSTIDIIFRSVSSVEPSMVIFNGDIKHGFGLLNTSEWAVLREFFSGLSQMKLDILVIRGNHDNYLGVLLDKYGIPFEKRWDHTIYTIMHGHESMSWDELGEVVIIGHEHPSVTLRDEVGVKFKFKCFMWGEYKGHKILVLPSVGELATGSTISLYSEEDILSPLLRNVNMSGFKPYAVVPGEIVQELPPLGDLERLL